MLARIVTTCIFALIVTLGGIACKSTKSNVSAKDDGFRSHVVLDRQFDDK